MTGSPADRRSRGSPPQIEVPESPSRESTITDFGSSLGNTLIESATNDNTITSNSQSVTDETAQKKKERKSRRHSGGINDYHLYREFRLKMVESFGSLAAAFYEVEREARAKLKDSKPRGEITRFDFFRIVNEKMQLFDEQETAALFAFLTNSDLEEQAVTVATYKHFGVREKQWNSVVRQKMLEDEGHQTGMFASTPQGTSTGLYLRPMHVEDAQERAKKLLCGSKPQGRPWAKPQTAWEPRVLAGDGSGLDARDICAQSRGRCAQMSFSVAPSKKLKKKLEYPLYSLLKKPERKKDLMDENTHLISFCPTRRAEMTDATTTLPIKWWPYKSKPRMYSQRSVTPR